MQELNMKMMVAQTTITNTQKDIKKINESIVEVADDTEEKRTLKNHVLRRRQLTDERELYTVASMLLKDNGIKTQIIRQYIPIMNTMINKYLERMDFFVQFNLDENFNETIKARYKDVFSYDSFSQGEKARIDLALMLTWRAISQMRNTSPCNLLLLDEVFDGSLDDTGTSALANMLSELTKTNVVVISHTQDDEHFEKCIKVRKEKNFSQYGS
jgi:DNA repair exonuclease SbcCD ATPase subunit